MSRVANVRRRQARQWALRFGRANHQGMLTFPPSLVARIMSHGVSGNVWKARTVQNRLAAKARRRAATSAPEGLEYLE